jgi:hypothetical protein
MDYTDHMEAPKLYRMWAGVSTIAGALRGKCFFDMGYFRWRPNFYVIFVAPPGVATKSTSFGVGAGLLGSVGGINFGPDSITWQALTDYMANNTEAIEINGVYYEMSNVTLSVSELGTFLDPKNGEMVDILVDLWDGRDSAKPWIRRTKGGGEEVIPQPFINIIGGTTPGWISERMTEYGITGGLASRSIFVYADSKAKLVPYPFLLFNDEDSQLKRDLITDLEAISDMAGPFELSSEALSLGMDWYEDHWNNVPEHLQGDRMGGYRARKQTHLHKLGMILSASQRDDRLISSKDFDVCQQILRQAEVDMHKVFSIISSGTENAKVENRVVDSLAKYHKPVEQTEFYRANLSSHMGYQDFDRAVSALVASGLVGRRAEGNRFFITNLVKPKKTNVEEPKL